MTPANLLIFFNGKNNAGKLDLKRFSYKFNYLSSYPENNFRIIFDSSINLKNKNFLAFFYQWLLNLKHKKQTYVALFVMPSVKDLALVIIFKLLTLGNLRIVPIIHNTRSHSSSNNYLINHLIKLVQSSMFYAADRVLFLSSDVMNSWLPSDKKFLRTNLPLLPKHKNFETNKNQNIPVLNVMSRDMGRLRILIIGRYLPYKKLTVLIEAMCHLISWEYKPFLEFRIIGSNYPKEDIIALSAKFSILEIPFQYIDQYVPDGQVDHLIMAADYILFWYVYASQSGFMQRSIELGTSVICNDVGGLKEQLGSASGLCIQSNSFSLAKCLINLPHSFNKKKISIPEVLSNDEKIISFLFS